MGGVPVTVLRNLGDVTAVAVLAVVVLVAGRSGIVPEGFLVALLTSWFIGFSGKGKRRA